MIKYFCDLCGKEIGSSIRIELIRDEDEDCYCEDCITILDNKKAEQKKQLEEFKESLKVKK
jgi:hypothetical protein